MLRDLKSTPNQLTMLRLVFVPLAAIAVVEGKFGLALTVFLLAGISDALDGFLARTLNQKTLLGQYLDPIADKLLLSSSFVVLAMNRQISWWLATIVLSRDILILMTAAVILVVVGYRPFPPSIYGKLTTALQITLVFAVVLLAVTQWPWLHQLRNGIVFFVAPLTVFSGVHYCFSIARRLNEPHA